MNQRRPIVGLKSSDEEWVTAMERGWVIKIFEYKAKIRNHIGSELIRLRLNKKVDKHQCLNELHSKTE